MKLVCPKCTSSLKVKAEKIPAVGGWARCPKCSEKFFVKAPGKSIDLLSETPQQAQRRQAGRDAPSQKLLNKMKSAEAERKAVTESLLVSSEVTIFPEPSASPEFYKWLALFVVALPLLIIIVIFIRSTPLKRVSSSPEIIYKEFVDENNENTIKSDLVLLKNSMIKRNRLSTTVETTGSESRVFKFFSSRLVPGRCDGISKIVMKSDDPGNGFKATATCVEGNVRELTMDLAWKQRSAVAGFPGYTKKLDEMEMYTLVPRAVEK